MHGPSRVGELKLVCITLVGRFLMGFRNLMEDLAIAMTSHAFGCAIVMHVAYFPMDNSVHQYTLGLLAHRGSRTVVRPWSCDAGLDRGRSLTSVGLDDFSASGRVMPPRKRDLGIRK